VSTLTPAQVAQELSVSADSVVRWIKSGRLAGVKVGGRYRTTRAAVDAFVIGPYQPEKKARRLSPAEQLRRVQAEIARLRGHP
jgi:excisionase family DNA binding protein